MKKIHEDHKEIASGKKADDEGYMARSELDSIERAVSNLRRSIKSGKQQLPAWVQSKITKAADYIDTAAEYLQSDEKVEEELSYPINTNKHKLERKKNIIGNTYLTTSGDKSSPEEKTSQNIAIKLGGTGVKYKKPKLKEQISLVEKILGEEKCGKGMYWCNTDKVCKPLPDGMKVPGQKIKPTEVGIGKPVAEGSCNKTGKGKSCPVHGMASCAVSEEKDPKGPTQPYKSPQELAKKHGVSLKEIQKQVEMGTKVESEHTSDKKQARITALQHIDEIPNYYTKLHKMETQKESNTVRDANGNVYAEFIDIIKSGSIEEENPGLWSNIHKRREKGLPKKKPGQKGYPKTLDIEEDIEQARKNVGADKCWKNKKLGNPPTKIKGGEEVPNCVPVKKGVKKAKGYKKESVDEATRLQAQNGNIISVVLSWRAKYYSVRIFFPQTRMPNRREVTDEIQKIYPGSRVVNYEVSDLSPGQPLIQMQNSQSKNYLLNNKTIGEEVEISEEKK
jgi:hypothetical protein